MDSTSVYGLELLVLEQREEIKTLATDHREDYLKGRKLFPVACR